MRRNKIILAGIAFMAIACASIYFINKSPAAEYFFVVDSTQAEILEDSSSSDIFILKMLVRDGHKATWFTDRPYRDAGQLTMSQLVSMWQTNEKNSFKTDPPNVSISFDDKIIVATMRKPFLYRDDTGKNFMQTTMTLVDESNLSKIKNDGSFLSKHAYRLGINLHGGSQKIKNVALFIDGHGSVPTDGSASYGGLDKSECPSGYPPGKKC
jgi:hypothetical protein